MKSCQMQDYSAHGDLSSIMKHVIPSHIELNKAYLNRLWLYNIDIVVCFDESDVEHINKLFKATKGTELENTVRHQFARFNFCHSHLFINHLGVAIANFLEATQSHD